MESVFQKNNSLEVMQGEINGRLLVLNRSVYLPEKDNGLIQQEGCGCRKKRWRKFILGDFSECESEKNARSGIFSDQRSVAKLISFYFLSQFQSRFARLLFK
ncbi:hypothetical protein TNIN_183601 [Trichonephila inaurata madagascariensis]|uniref:Uncharacterized protein n=1 Tax=Trichonephila inaurata madagascariensis TaxID=2747483 RepID=A0A8X7C8L8_9ARAC|nr:hypothetical protein TNIN_183601 [Trichonephila inaurata madagascariensis]